MNKWFFLLFLFPLPLRSKVNSGVVPHTAARFGLILTDYLEHGWEKNIRKKAVNFSLVVLMDSCTLFVLFLD